MFKHVCSQVLVVAVTMALSSAAAFAEAEMIAVSTPGAGGAVLYCDMVKKVHTLGRASGAEGLRAAAEKAKSECVQQAGKPSDCVPCEQSRTGASDLQGSGCLEEVATSSIGLACFGIGKELYCRVGCGKSIQAAREDAENDCKTAFGVTSCGSLGYYVTY